MSIIENNLDYPVEYLVFQLEDPNTIEEFINCDFEVWTSFLKDCKGFVSKQIWVNDTTPGEIHAIISWKTVEDWKSIELDQLKEIDKKFQEKYIHGFNISRRVHKEYSNGLFEVCNYTKCGG